MDWLCARFVVLIAASLGIASLRGAENVDKETEKALEAAAKNAESMGIKMPDLKALMEDDKKEKSATEAAKESATPKAAKTSGSSLCLTGPLRLRSSPQMGRWQKRPLRGRRKLC